MTRLMAAQGLTPPSSAVVERAKGTVEPGVDFSGEWEDVANGETIVVRQHGNEVFVTPRRGSTQRWTIDGSVAFFCGFDGGEDGGTIRSFSVRRARLPAPDAMAWELETSLIREAYGDVTRFSGTRYWRRADGAE